MKSGRQPRWQPHEDAVLARMWGKLPEAKVAAKLPGRNVAGCQQRASKLGLKSERRERALKGDRGYKGDEFYLGILADFAVMSAGEMAAQREEPLCRVRDWIDRAKKYRDNGKIKLR